MIPRAAVGAGKSAPQRSESAALTLALTELVSWGILYYAFTVIQTPMQRELGWSRSALTGAFSLALLLSAIGVGELLLTTQEVIGRSFKTMEFYALAGALYLALNLLIGAGGWFVERRFRLR